MDEPGHVTLTEAAARTGHSREALRQRIRRGSLASSKGNDGQVRIRIADLDDLPPPDATVADPGDENELTRAVIDVLRTTADDLRLTVDRLTENLGSTRRDLDAARVYLMDSNGRAERAEATLAAERARADRAEALAAASSAALADARTPLVLRLVRAWRR